MEPQVTKLVIKNVLCITNNELYAIAFTAGVLGYTIYTIGRERERQWLKKHMHTISEII